MDKKHLMGRSIAFLLAVSMVFSNFTTLAATAEDEDILADTGILSEEAGTNDLDETSNSEAANASSSDIAEDADTSATSSDTAADAGIAVTDSGTISIQPSLNGVEGQDVTSYITFSDGTLTVGSTEITQNSDYSFTYTSAYKFTINWATINTSTTFDANDYFTFTVPAEFAPTSGTRWITISSDTGVPLGTIEIYPGGSATAVFNSNINGLQELSGTITLTGNYIVIEEGVEVDWIFEFGSTIYEYTGESAGYIHPDSLATSNKIYKTGSVSSISDAYVWYIYANQSQDALTGAITLTDTFGSGYDLRTIPNRSVSSDGYYAIDSDPSNPYFCIYTIDWNAMRADYNQKYVTDGEQMTTGYVVNGEVPPGQYSLYMLYVMRNEVYTQVEVDAGLVLPAGKTVGSYKYMTLYTGGITGAVKTDDGFEILFPDGALNEQCLYIQYYVELTSAMVPDKITNDASIEGSNVDNSTSSYMSRSQ